MLQAKWYNVTWIVRYDSNVHSHQLSCRRFILYQRQIIGEHTIN